MCVFSLPNAFYKMFFHSTNTLYVRLPYHTTADKVINLSSVILCLFPVFLGCSRCISVGLGCSRWLGTPQLSVRQSSNLSDLTSGQTECKDCWPSFHALCAFNNIYSAKLATQRRAREEVQYPVSGRGPISRLSDRYDVALEVWLSITAISKHYVFHLWMLLYFRDAEVVWSRLWSDQGRSHCEGIIGRKSFQKV